MSQKKIRQDKYVEREMNDRKSQSTQRRAKKIPEAVAQYIKGSTSKEDQIFLKQRNKSNTNLRGQEFVCQICQIVHSTTKKKSISSCGHDFCTNCMEKYISYKIQSFQAVECPNGECEEELGQKSSLYLNLTAVQKSKYQKRKRYDLTLKNDKLKLCPDENCNGYLKTKDNQSDVIKKLKCDSCKKTFCAQCMLPEHKGQCDSYSLQFFQKSLNLRQCPNCKFMVQKNQGCDHITCRCKHQFCYRCGKNWVNGHNCGLPPRQMRPPPYTPCCCLCCHSCCDEYIAPICLACDDNVCFWNCLDTLWGGFYRFIYSILWISFVVPATYIQLIILILLRVIGGTLYGLFGFWHIGPDFLKDTGINQWSTPAKVAAGIFFPLSWLCLIGYTIKKMFEGVEEILTVQYIAYLPFRLLNRCLCP